MKKILFILDTIDIGGATKLTFDIINEFDRELFDIEIIYLNDARFKGENLLHFYKFEKNSKLLWYKNFRSLRRIIYFYRNLRKYDLVHSCMEQSNFYTSFVKSLPFSDFKLVMTYHGLDSVYTIDDSHFKLRQKVSYKIVMKNLQNKLYYKVNSVISVCNDLKNYLIIKRGIDPGKIKVIYHGINIRYFDNLKKKSDSGEVIPDKKYFTLGYIGRLGYSKGLEGFTDSIKQIKEKIPNLKVVIKGDGELRDFIENKILSEKYSDFVTLEKFEKNVQDFYRKIDLLILPSYYETTNLTILEAMYSGTPVLASNTGGLPEIISDGSNGFLFKCGDFDDLVKKISRINKLNNEKMDSIKIFAKETVNNKFNLNENIKKIQSEFMNIINPVN